MQVPVVTAWALIGILLALALRPTVIRYTTTTEANAIQPRHGAPEIITGVLFAALAYRYGPSLELLATSTIAVLGVPLASIDLSVRRLPNRLLAVAYLVVLGLIGLDAIVRADATAALRALACLLIALTVHGVLYAFGTLGGGDLKLTGILAAVLGWFSWQASVTGMVLGWILGALAVLALRLARKRTFHADVPLGAFLITASLIALLVSTPELWPVGARLGRP